MQLEEYKKKKIQEINSNIHKRDILLNAGLGMTQYTGKLNGNIKTIVYGSSKQEKQKQLQIAKKNLEKIMEQIVLATYAINSSLEEIIKEE